MYLTLCYWCSTGLDYLFNEARKRNLKVCDVAGDAVFLISGRCAKYASCSCAGIQGTSTDTKSVEMMLSSDLQVIAVLLDNWKATGGVDEYVAWTNNAKATHSSFFTDPQIKQW